MGTWTWEQVRCHAPESVLEGLSAAEPRELPLQKLAVLLGAIGYS